MDFLRCTINVHTLLKLQIHESGVQAPASTYRESLHVILFSTTAADTNNLYSEVMPRDVTLEESTNNSRLKVDDPSYLIKGLI